MMSQGIDVDLPDTTTQNLRMKDEPLVLTIDKAGKYYLGRREISAATLAVKLEAIFEGRDSKEIFLRADENVAYSFVVKALAAAQQAGATKLGMVTESEK